MVPRKSSRIIPVFKNILNSSKCDHGRKVRSLVLNGVAKGLIVLNGLKQGQGLNALAVPLNPNCP